MVRGVFFDKKVSFVNELQMATDPSHANAGFWGDYKSVFKPADDDGMA